jgi:apolipoprotein N-acyltransferase
MLHLCDNPSVRSLLLSGLAGLVLVVAFPPYGQAYLTVPCVAVLFWVLRTAPSRRVAIGSAGVFGLAFFGMLFPWLGELGLEAFMPLWILQSGYACLFGWWAWWVRDLPTLRWAAGSGRRVGGLRGGAWAVPFWGLRMGVPRISDGRVRPHP